MKTDWVSMQVRCFLGHCSFRGLGYPRWEQLGESGIWRGSLRAVGGRTFAQTMSRMGCSLLSGSFQRWLVTVGSSRGSSLGHLRSLRLLQERCCGRGTASGWEGHGRGQEICREREGKAFCSYELRVPMFDGMVISCKQEGQPWEKRDREGPSRLRMMK